MSQHNQTAANDSSDRKRAAAEELVRKLGSLEKAKDALEELQRLRKAA